MRRRECHEHVRYPSRCRPGDHRGGGRRLFERTGGRLDCAGRADSSARRFGSGRRQRPLPADFPIGVLDDRRSPRPTCRPAASPAKGELGENSGDLHPDDVADDGTWTTAQVADVPLHWPVFKGTWTATGPDGFRQVTTFPQDFAGDVVDFTWKIENGALKLKVVNPPDPILPIIMESHPWQPAG